MISPLLLGLLVVAAVIEALILYQTKWATLAGSFRDAAAINAASAALLLLIGPLLNQIGNVLAVVAVAWLLSIVAEGFVLMLLRRRPAAASYFTSMIVNTASYIFVLLYVLSFLLI
jgi:hypothetical protein